MVKLNNSDNYEHLCNVKLTKEKFPIAFEHKVHELMTECRETRENAEHMVSDMEIELELYYEEGTGLFAVESDAVDCSRIYSPYTGEVSEETEVIDLVPSNPCSSACTEYSEENQNLIDMAKNTGHETINVGYLDGDVEAFAGYDICCCINGEEITHTAENGKLVYKEGVYDAKLVGYDNPLRMFVWNDPEGNPRMLIVDIKDEASHKNAQEKFKQKVRIL